MKPSPPHPTPGVQMKLGYVSRAHPRDNYNHTVLTVQGYKPGEFASQITLGMNNMWGILKVGSRHTQGLNRMG